jgi:hypothetical protein
MKLRMRIKIQGTHHDDDDGNDDEEQRKCDDDEVLKALTTPLMSKLVH